ncbi:hypothetical protein AKJ09_10512 [Labilithrix luteola]|uniref:Uncharacterized protein n=1 Tax=Labilithrix luteola TaxID=1391654 RepID=A0A0K1QDL0_9BACT|nr:hypothetical protein [Labilithrix luteola]AKV03849.1 hypothetical protein AKJ09_10512 [Labilithrix luteola]
MTSFRDSHDSHRAPLFTSFPWSGPRLRSRLQAGAAALAFFATIAGASAASAAETVAYEVTTTAGNQNYENSIGMDFDVAKAVDVYELGVFDDGADGFAHELTAYIYDRDTQALVTKLTFAPGMTGRLVGSSRFLPLPCPLHLPVDFHGSIVADGFSDADHNGNRNLSPTPDADAWTTHDGGGALVFTGKSRYGSAPNAYPTSVDAYVDNYAAGSFVFAEACTANTDCTNTARPTCANGLCGASTGSFFAGCTGATASCDTTTATCAACSADHPSTAAMACRTADMPACVSGACVQCSETNTSKCTTETAPACGENHECAACQTDFGGTGPAKCPTAEKGKCRTDGKCAVCTGNADCGTDEVCNATGECVDAPKDGGTDGGTDAGTDGGKDAGKDDAGSPGTDAGKADSGSSTGGDDDGGAVTPIEPSASGEDDSGCSVSSSGTTGSSMAVLGIGVALAMAMLRRKR